MDTQLQCCAVLSVHVGKPGWQLMGASNVSKAFTHWAHLDDRSFRILCRMALVSMDNGEPPKYWAGRDDLALALGKTVPAKPEESDHSPEAETLRRIRASTYEVVRKAVAKLAKEGVISSSGDARFRNRAEYSLHLDPAQTQQIVAPDASQPSELAQQIVAPMAQQIVAPLTQQIVVTGPTDHWALGVEEPLEEEREEEADLWSAPPGADEQSRRSAHDERNRQSAGLQPLIAEWNQKQSV